MDKRSAKERIENDRVATIPQSPLLSVARGSVRCSTTIFSQIEEQCSRYHKIVLFLARQMQTNIRSITTCIQSSTSSDLQQRGIGQKRFIIGVCVWMQSTSLTCASELLFSHQFHSSRWLCVCCARRVPFFSLNIARIDARMLIVNSLRLRFPFVSSFVFFFVSFDLFVLIVLLCVMCRSPLRFVPTKVISQTESAGVEPSQARPYEMSFAKRNSLVRLRRGQTYM